MRAPARSRAPAGPLIAVALAYLSVASGIMIWRGLSVSPDYILLLLVPVALASGRLWRFLTDWVPFVALFLGYEAMRGIAARSGIAPHVADLLHAELWLNGGHLPTSVLQNWVGSHATFVDYLCTVVYFSHFAVPAAVGFTIWVVDRRLYVRYVLALLGMSFAAFVVYLLFPTGAPWYAQEQGLVDGFHHVIGTTLPSTFSPYYATLNPNFYAALPSLHAAYPFLGFLAMRHAFPRAAWVLMAWALLVWFTVVYLGEHYTIDVAAGVLWAVVAWLLVERVAVPHIAALREPATPAGTAPAAAA